MMFDRLDRRWIPFQRRWLSVLIFTVTLVPQGATLAQSRQNWLASPMRVAVWCDCRVFDPKENKACSADWFEAMEASSGYPWQFERQEIPQTVHAKITSTDNPPDANHLLHIVPALDRYDGLFVVTVTEEPFAWHVRSRILDIRSRQWVSTQNRPLFRIESLPFTIAQMFAEHHYLVGRVTRVFGNSAEMEFRAGLLMEESDPSRLPAKGSTFAVWLRKNDRLGQLLDDGIHAVPWTILRVESVQHGRAQCSVYSGLRSPLRVRSSHQVERLTLPVVSRFPATQLRLTTDSSDRHVAPSMEVLQRSPDADSAEFLGTTDARGQILVPRGDTPLNLIYVRHGTRLVARLPIVVGAEEELDVRLPRDDERVEAEGFLRTIEGRILETAAQRQVLNLRIQRQLQQGNVDEARSLLETWRDLPTRDDFLRLLRERQQQWGGLDRNTRAALDSLFQKTRSVLMQQLDPREVDQISRQVQAGSNAATK